MRSIRTLLVTVITALFSTQALASGITLHLWMAERATQDVTLTDLSDLLKAESAAYQNGSVFPDSGYIINHPYGEYAHWSDFLNSYFAVVQNRCPNLQSEECSELFSHFLGVLAHVVSDINFDRHFVQEVGRQNFGGDWNEAQKYTDTGLDFIAIMEQGRAFKIPAFSLPADALVEAMELGGEVQASPDELLKGMSIVRLGLTGEPLGAPFAYLYYKNKIPWAAKNYVSARGGVEDTARRIARAWELTWLAFHRKADQPLFLNEGNWPNADFYVDGQHLETFFAE